MEIYSSAVSPFSVRVALGAAAKGQEVRTRSLPAGGVRSDEFLHINPVGKIPVLVTDDGHGIAESAAILGYLEHCFPSPSLLPVEAAARARMDSACRIVDLYFAAPVIRLFRQLDPAGRNDDAVGQEVQDWIRGARLLSEIVASPSGKVQAPWSMLDCMLAPTLHLSRRISAMLDLPEDPAVTGGLKHCHDSYMAHPGIGPFLRALSDAQHDYDLSAGRRSVRSHH
ncbi:glutathione S-transferase family protein [Luteimonas sp. A537]